MKYNNIDAVVGVYIIYKLKNQTKIQTKIQIKMKKTFKKLACMAMVASLGVGAIMAQDTQTTNTDSKKVEYSIHLGASTPLGSFRPHNDFHFGYLDAKLSWNDDITYGDADFVGANIGVKAKYNISGLKGLGIIATADVLFNTAADFYIKEVVESDAHLTEYFYSAYINIPVMVGANYNYAINDKVSIWGEAAIGANLRIITSDIFDYKRSNGIDIKDYTEINYDNCFTLGFQAGLGIMLKNKYSIGLHYYNLGNKAVTEKYTEIIDFTNASGHHYVNIINEPRTKPPLKTTMLLIRFGYHF